MTAQMLKDEFTERKKAWERERERERERGMNREMDREREGERERVRNTHAKKTCTYPNPFQKPLEARSGLWFPCPSLCSFLNRRLINLPAAFVCVCVCVWVCDRKRVGN